jgi:hypothetical protein
MKPLALLLFFFTSYAAIAQSSDILLLKKKNITVATYSAGNHIAFTATNGNYVEADITSIQNDTLYLRQYAVHQVFTTLGVYMPDTVNSYYIKYSYEDILSIPKTGRHFDVAASGNSLFAGGILLTVASGIVYVADRSKFSPGLLIAGASLGVIGYFMSKHNSDEYKIGKKYKLSYLSVSSNKKQ